MPPLPHPLTEMATVQWRDQVVLLGGYGDEGKLNSVIMYDSKTVMSFGLTSDQRSTVGTFTGPNSSTVFPRHCLSVNAFIRCLGVRNNEFALSWVIPAAISIGIVVVAAYKSSTS
ncbi:uncharacterized protein LOC124449641 [Xenia sp. Carnegie-2017]|uniref:uncharacterized protein LOC124449641 n=1 Tax=Xenia sp. Carnegie-2017 TaxID=2897299 RepID=UPI001F034183|nr:uncharacterized protein LOC124449641 [Xenia sp. Carnegie-2017]